MNKFFINNILIEKSEKDIETNKEYSLSSGFNLLFGNNEAGKSSLMKFIKSGFFNLDSKEKRTEIGKIFFNFAQKSYRADVEEKTAIPSFFDENNKKLDSSLLINVIDKRYFENGFTIDLEDITFKNKDDDSVLLNAIKDPANSLINKYIKDLSDEIKNYLGKKNVIIGDTKQDSLRINEINSQIREKMNLEGQYNRVLLNLKLIEQELNEIANKEDVLNIYKTIEEYIYKIQQVDFELKEKAINFNQKLIDNKQNYDSLLSLIGKYDKKSEETLASEIDLLNQKIKENLIRLNRECNVFLDEENIKNFNIVGENIQLVKKLFAENSQLKEQIINKEQEKILTKNNINNLKKDVENLVLEYQDDKVDELKELNSFLDDKLYQYNVLSQKVAELTSKNKPTKVKPIILFAISSALILSFGYLIYSVLNKDISTSIFSAIIVISSFISIFSLMTKNKGNDDIDVINENLKNLIKELREKSSFYVKDLSSCLDFVVYSKLEKVKKEIENKITAYDKKQNVDKNIKLENETLSRIEEKIKELNNAISLNGLKIKELTEEKLSDLVNSSELYFMAIEIINTLKNNIKTKTESIEKLAVLTTSNTKIYEELKGFIVQNDLAISLDENIEKIVSDLKQIVKDNNDLNAELNVLKVKIDCNNSEIKELKEKAEKLQEKLKEKINNEHIDLQIEELNNKKQELKTNRDTLLVEKSKLEAYEGFEALENEKDFKINELREIAKKLYINKITVELLQKAKNSFNKTRPCLVNAEKYLELLTNGKYTKIDLDIKRIANDKETKAWNELSRGTKEQLYFALRLGYAANYSNDENNHPNLPLIIDDAFVNFDTIRTKKALECLLEFSKTNQVLFFTCHEEEIKKLIEEIKKENNSFSNEVINEINIKFSK